MNCPRCPSGRMSERPRDGIMIDVCTECRGVWLDRGELEKLIARASREAEEDWPRREQTDVDHDDDDDDRGRRRGGKRRWFESFGDIFD
jgi:Zn-finger nucleic acid-binding protein